MFLVSLPMAEPRLVAILAIFLVVAALVDLVLTTRKGPSSKHQINELIARAGIDELIHKAQLWEATAGAEADRGNDLYRQLELAEAKIAVLEFERENPDAERCSRCGAPATAWLRSNNEAESAPHG